MSDLVLSATGIRKRFCRNLKRSLMYGVFDIVSDLSGKKTSERLRDQEFWAVDGVTFDLHRGEALGLVGANGAGKTTLLRVLSGLILPDGGQYSVNGRLAPLIALGAGFNPVLTGRENIEVNLAILGLRRREIREVYDQVVEFAELGHAMDAPLRTYSSGMAARLGFACAVHSNPDLLVVDEVLAVGDVRFRLKCYERIARLRDQGTALMLVTHNPNALLAVCPRSLYLRDGRLEKDGPTPEILSTYDSDLLKLNNSKVVRKIGNSLDTFSIQNVLLRDENGQSADQLRTGHAGSINVDIRSESSHDDVNVDLIISESMGEGRIVVDTSTLTNGESIVIGQGRTELSVNFPIVSLKPGPYMVKAVIGCGMLRLAIIEGFRFDVEAVAEVSMRMRQSLYFQPTCWTSKPQNSPGPGKGAEDSPRTDENSSAGGINV